MTPAKKNKTILVTGCAGLIGNHFARYLLNKNYLVIGVDNFFGGYPDYLPEHPNFKFYNLCLSKDYNKLGEIFEEYHPEATYHFAAYAAEGLSPFIRRFNYENNVLASMAVVNNCINYNSKLIFTSSMAVYGHGEPPFTEDLLPAPCDPYGIAKYAVEQDIQTAAMQFGLEYNIVRPHNVLGIYQNIWDKYRNVIGIFIRRALNNEPILVYGDGKQTRAFSDIYFYMEPLEKLISDFDGEIFNIGADKYWSINEIAHLVSSVAKKHDIETAIQHKEPRKEVKHAFCDHTKAKEMLDFKDGTNINKLVEEMFEWGMSQPARDSKYMDYEVVEGIYTYWK